MIQDHLQGRHVIGVYPLLRDECCCLLAIDFDKGSWAEDVGAFAEACRAVGNPTAVERSRSGDGAHAWFFFDKPIAAIVARRLGCYLLTGTMPRHPELGMDWYDRLFPNQDTMPRGGFGNLIALPLQRDARERGNTIFVDDALRPHPDQWAFLAGVQRIPAATADLVAREAQRQGRVLGVRFAAADEDDAPWTRSPSGRIPRTAVLEPLPQTVRIVRGQRLFIEKAGLPGGFVTELRRVAAFQNPEFYKKRAMHLGTSGTPRVATCTEESGAFRSLPRGCEADAVALVTEWGGKVRPRSVRSGREGLGGHARTRARSRSCARPPSRPRGTQATRSRISFVQKLRGAARNLVVLNGGLSARERKEALELVAAIPDDEERLVLATGRYVGEGFDDPRLNTLVLALPVAWRGTVVQYARRLHRKHAGRTEVRIRDYRDGNLPVLARMLEKRVRAYRAIGYEIDEPAPRAAPAEHVTEYDEGQQSPFPGPIRHLAWCVLARRGRWRGRGSRSQRSAPPLRSRLA